MRWTCRNGVVGLLGLALSTSAPGCLLAKEAAGPFFEVSEVHVPGVPGLSTAKAIDLDRDGDLDVLAIPYGENTSSRDEGSEPEPATIAAYRNVGGGVFEPASKQLIRGKLASFSVVGRNAIIADFNGDGMDDLYLGDGGADNGGNPGAQNQLAFATRKGPLKPGRRSGYPSFLEWTHGVAVGDVDGDGDLDLFEANIGICCGRARGSALLINNGKGKFELGNERLEDGFEVVIGSSVQTAAAQAAELVDYDRDGDLDLVVGTNHQPDYFPPGRAHILPNDGLGNFLTFAPNQPIPETRPDSSTLNIEQGDINGDGWLDLVFGATTDAAETFVQILLNDRQGGFEDGNRMLPGNDWILGDYVRLADLNGDGWPDLVFAFDRLRVLINQRGKSFAEAKGIFAPGDEGRLNGDATVADLDGDGDLDLLTTPSDAVFYFAENVSPYEPQKRLRPAGRATRLSASPIAGGYDLSWKHARRATHYTVELSDVVDFSSVLYDLEGYTGAALAIEGIVAGRLYYWRVRGHNLSGAGKWSFASFTAAP